MKNKRLVELCAISDGDYLVPAMVMLTSAKVNKAPESHYRVHLLVTSPNPFYEERAKMLSSPDFEVIVRHVELTHSEQHLSENRKFAHISGTSMVRCRLSSLLPDISRVLYLDGDIIVRGDLTEYFHMDMQNKSLAGVWDIGEWDGPGSHSRHEVGSANYVNSGALLMNLERMRANGVGRVIELLESNPPSNWKWVDQDIINAGCPDEEKLILPPRYNCMALLFKLRPWSIETVNAFYESKYANLTECEGDALILHMAGSQKPWNQLNCFGSDLWKKYYDASPLGNLSWTRDVHIPHIYVPTSAGESATPCHVWHVRLLDVLPLLTIRSTPSTVRVRLFGFLPVLKVKRRQGVVHYRLFHFLPLLRIKDRGYC